MSRNGKFGFLSDMHAAGKLLACCSTAISVAVMLGGLLLPFFSQPSQLRAGLAWFANQLPIARKNDVSCVKREESPSDLSQSVGERTAHAMAPFQSGLEVSDPIGIIISTTADPGVSDSTPEGSVAPTVSTSPEQVDATAQLKRSWSAPIDWLFDKPGSRSVLALSRFSNRVGVTGFSIDGINTSDLSLTQVRGIVKPDKSSDDIELVLSLRGDHLNGGTIPPRTPFSLVYQFPEHQNGVPINVFLAKIGGAVFTFKYTLAGDHRTLITYLSESTIKQQLLAGLKNPTGWLARPGGKRRSAQITSGVQR